MTSFHNRPEDAVQDIFLRLPADALVLFKRVSKYWYALICSLIKDPLFVSKNLQNFKHKSSSSLIIRRPCPP
ncbi:hypothetical protein L484_011529 [Morus notabilis]|uniref:F-box domain-containing protein n=1 Tax=Morus notabilis TaxID=981085 RepID=W9RNP8_9ROSA|nr:hypothetical protein L484_011529 [Morus notabilis]